MSKVNPEKGALEKELLKTFQTIIGIDEVGRGCLAGPVYAAAVQLDYEKLWALSDKERSLIRDSKKLSHKQRVEAMAIIDDIAIQSQVCSSSVREIEALGIVNANFRAMRRALSLCKQPADMLLLDGNAALPRYKGRQTTVVGGDSLCFTIAAASILAKEKRDTYMIDQAKAYPAYGFDSNMGYGTKAHLDGLSSHGICRHHRRNFAPIQKHLNTSANV